MMGRLGYWLVDRLAHPWVALYSESKSRFRRVHRSRIGPNLRGFLVFWVSGFTAVVVVAVLGFKDRVCSSLAKDPVVHGIEPEAVNV